MHRTILCVLRKGLRGQQGVVALVSEVSLSLYVFFILRVLLCSVLAICTCPTNLPLYSAHWYRLLRPSCEAVRRPVVAMTAKVFVLIRLGEMIPYWVVYGASCLMVYYNMRVWSNTIATCSPSEQVAIDLLRTLNVYFVTAPKRLRCVLSFGYIISNHRMGCILLGCGHFDVWQ